MIDCGCGSIEIAATLVSFVGMEEPVTEFSAIDAALDEIITGSGVRRSKHELTIDRRDVSRRFQAALERHHYFPTTVGKVDVPPGERVPAFYLDGSTAYFGWVFWEKFTETKQRKLWGSVVLNSKGDWAIQFSQSSRTIIFANLSLKVEMDIENPR